MSYTLRCDSCALDREATDWTEASRRASDHEADHPDHWVTILEDRPARTGDPTA